MSSTHPTTRRHTIGALMALALIGLAPLSGCSDGEPPDDGATGTGATPNHLERLATMLPQDPAELGFGAQLVDLDLAHESADLDRPGPDADPDADPDAVADHIIAMEEAGVYRLPTPLQDGRWSGLDDMVSAIRSDYGIDLFQIRSWTSWSATGPDVMVLIGGFTPDDVAEAAQTNDWPGDMIELDHRGITIYSWLDDNEVDLMEGTATNTTGSARRIAVVDDMFLLAPSTPVMHQLIDRALDDPAPWQMEHRRLLSSVLGPEAWATRLYTARGLDSSDLLGFHTTPTDDGEQPANATFAIAPAGGSNPDEVVDEVEAVVDSVFDELEVAEVRSSLETNVEDDLAIVELDLTAANAALGPDQVPDPMNSGATPAEVLMRHLHNELIGGSYTNVGQ